MRQIAILVAGVFVGPAVAIGIARALRSEALGMLPAAPLEALCDDANRAADAGRMRVCAVLEQVAQLESAALWLIAATGVLGLPYVAVVFGLAKRREWLATAFPLVVPLCLAALVAVLVMQGLLLAASFYELLQTGHARRMNLTMLALSAGLFLAAGMIVASWRKLLRVEPARVRESLLESSVPHPLDSHPPIAARARALGVDPTRVLGTAVVALASLRSSGTGLGALERRLSALECEELRIPGR